MTNELVKRPLIKKIRKVFLSNWRLYVLLLPALLWLFVFRYTPMYGLTLAFKDFSIRKGILDSPWVGLKYFRQFFSTSIAWTLVKNTLILSLESLAFVFPIPIIFALFLNQLRYSKFKKIVQTISFAPYFISNVVVISIMTVILAPGNGFVNVFLQSLGCEPLMLMTKPEYFRPMLFAALASAESIEDYITESGLPIVTDASKLEEMDILWVASPLCQLEPHEIAWIKQNEAETGMKFNWQKINSEGATEKMPVILSADELPDIIWNGISKDMLSA